ncbi:DNA-directed RNA polymerase subunit beta' [Ceratobasidium sp. AG-Ba]|nr:DNA-directed RNA polymerase subunit beta' [Ceratobasidium sp. AG-Ba]
MLKTKVIDLGAIKMVKPKPPEITSSESAKHVPTHQLPPSTTRLPAYERLANEVPGRELAPEATVWEMYVEEAKEHDSELVKGENDNLDMMLLFAALFSAILTAFIIESKSLLQQDSADVSVTLLLAIAQSQQRIEQGTPQVLPPIEMPAFAAPAAARWINGLWFAALALSLAAALVAMLAKEWLTAFMVSRPRAPHAYALMHHRRLQGLKQWGALHMIDLLPSMLHLSLLLFSVGLAVYLWQLDSGIAIAEVVITAATILFYAGTVLLGALYDSCPFVTQMSKYTRVLFEVLHLVQDSRNPGSKNPTSANDGQTTEEEFHTLHWLIETARDPVIVDCSLQVLTSLNLRPQSQPLSTKLGPEYQEPITLKGKMIQIVQRPYYSLKNKRDDPVPRRQKALVDMYHTLCARILEARSHLQQDPPEHRGLNLVQLSHAIPAIARHVYSQPPKAISELAVTSLIGLFELFDLVWGGAFPELLPDRYASFLTAELRTIQAAISDQRRNRPKEAEPVVATDNDSAIISVWANDEMEDMVSFELRARYSRALVRAGSLLTYHISHEMSISPPVLIRLVDTIRGIGSSNRLNPDSPMSTSYPQFQAEPDLLPSFEWRMVQPGSSRVFNPFDLGDENLITTGLVRLIAPAMHRGALGLHTAIVQALRVMFPKLLKQWVNMMKIHRGEEFASYSDKMELALNTLRDWPAEADLNQHDHLAVYTLRQLLIVVKVVAILNDGYQYMSSLPYFANEALQHAISAVSLQIAYSGRGFSPLECNTISKLVHACLLFFKNMGTRIPIAVLDCVSVGNSDGTVLAQTNTASLYNDDLHFPELMWLIAKSSYGTAGSQRILGAIEYLIRKDGLFWLSKQGGFHERQDYFDTLSNLGERPEYVSAVSRCISAILARIGKVDFTLRRYDVNPVAVPAMLRAASLAVRHMVRTDVAQSQTVLFDLMRILGEANSMVQKRARQCPEISILYQAVVSAAKLHEELLGVVGQLEEWASDDWMLDGIAGLFGCVDANMSGEEQGE